MENEVKEPAPKYDYLSPQEYLEYERAAEYKNEYYHGQVLGMSGASLKHNILDKNLVSLLAGFLKGNDCNVLPGNMRVSTPSHDAYMYPDAIIYCGDPVLEDDKFDTLLNPVVIFEILSPSTRSIDKGLKFFFYQQISSLKEYFMIDSLKRVIHVARKQAGNTWAMETLTAEAAEMDISSIGLKLPFDLLYEGTGL